MRYPLGNVMRIFKRTPQPTPLGHLEALVMDVMWVHGEGNVRDVIDKIDRPLAYTTVMTTLDRLFKKRLLDRRKLDRAFIYFPCLSRNDWERQLAGELVAGFLAGPKQDLLISCLLDKVGHDEAVLDELERKIKLKRQELDERKS
jgi:predicted transcriptional regulator